MRGGPGRTRTSNQTVMCEALTPVDPAESEIRVTFDGSLTVGADQREQPALPQVRPVRSAGSVPRAGARHQEGQFPWPSISPAHCPLGARRGGGCGRAAPRIHR